MKRFLTLMFAVVLSTGVLTGCGDANNNVNNNNANNVANDNVEEVNEDVVNIVVSDEDGEVLSEKEVAVDEGDIMLDVLKDNFDIEEEGGFINGVDGVIADESEQLFWAISVNGEMTEVGAGEFELTPGDEVTLDIQGW